MRAIVSSGPAPFISTPKCAARDSPATSATGTARISGQGVATTSTATARIGSPVNHHAAKAMLTVTARNPSDQRSASRDIGAFEAYRLSAFPGDYNLDGRVDAADYSVWRDQRDTTALVPFSGADGTGDGQVDQADRDLWVANYGRTTPIDSRVTPPQAEFAPAAVVATPAPSESVAEPAPAPAVDAAPFTNATAAAVDSCCG